MFSNFIKKVGEFEREINGQLQTASPAPSSPAFNRASSTSVTDTVEYWKKLAEAQKIEQQKLEQEISSLTTQNAMFSKKNQEIIDDNLKLDAELRKLRLQAKLKMSQLRKELDICSGKGDSVGEGVNAITASTKTSDAQQALEDLKGKSGKVPENPQVEADTHNFDDERFKKLSMDLESSNQLIAEQKTTLESAQEEIKYQKSENDSLLAKYNRLKMENEAKINEINDLKKTAASSNTSEQQYPPNNDNNDQTTRDHLKALEEKNGELQQLINVYAEKSKQYESQISRHLEEIQQLKNSSDSELVEQLISQIKDKASTIQTLTLRAQELDLLVTSKEDVIQQKAQEIESLKKESEKKKDNGTNFILEEMVQDLKIQLASRQMELNSNKEALQTKISDAEKCEKAYEDKIKKLKSILVAANKNVSENKILIVQKDAEILELKNQINHTSNSDNDKEVILNETKKMNESLLAELENFKISRTTELEEFERFKAQSLKELSDLKSEYNSYKIRAHAALQKNSTSAFEIRIAELENSKNDLNAMLRKKDAEITNCHSKIKALESDLTLAGEQIQSNISQLDKLHIYTRDIDALKSEIASLNRKFLLEQELYQENMHGKEVHYNKLLENMKLEVNKAVAETGDIGRRKEEENAELNNICERLSTELSALRKELSKVHEDLEDEKRKKKLEAATSSSAEQSKYNTDADLISPAILSPPMDTFKEKELLLQTEQLSELLSESEQTVQRLTEQEMVLKEELRKRNREDAREKNLNIEYLKNVVLSFLESEAKEPLLLVIAQVLHLSPEEVKSLREKVIPQSTISSSWW